MAFDNLGNPIPIGFNSRSDFMRARDSTRYAARQHLSPNPHALLPQSLYQSPTCHVRITGAKNDEANAYPAIFTFRNLGVSSGDPNQWIDGEICMAFGINDGELVPNQRYQGLIYGVVNWKTLPTEVIYTTPGYYVYSGGSTDSNSSVPNITNPVIGGSGRGITSWTVGTRCIYLDYDPGPNVTLCAGPFATDALCSADGVACDPAASMFVAVEDDDLEEDDEILSDCAWLMDVPKATCLKVRMLGGFGRFAEMPADPPCGGTDMVWKESLGGYIAVTMKDTCCGCGSAIFRITDADNMISTLELKGIHISCSTGSGESSIASITMKQTKCGRTRQRICLVNGAEELVVSTPYVIFASTDIRACNGEVMRCENVFRVMVKCGTCPPVICACSCIGASPYSWYYDVLETFSPDNTRLNGDWVIEYDETQTCTWTGNCDPNNDGGKTSTLAFAGTVWRLTHGHFIYEIAVASWVPSGNNTLTYVSGAGAHPATIIIEPILPIDLITGAPDDQVCSPPDVLIIEVDAPDCPLFDGASITVTRTAPGSNSWTWTNPSPTGDYIGAASLSCVDGLWVVDITGECSDGPSPFAITSDGILPSLQTFVPFQITWASVPVTGSDPSGEPGCCNVSTASVNVLAA